MWLTLPASGEYARLVGNAANESQNQAKVNKKFDLYKWFNNIFQLRIAFVVEREARGSMPCFCCREKRDYPERAGLFGIAYQFATNPLSGAGTEGTAIYIRANRRIISRVSFRGEACLKACLSWLMAEVDNGVEQFFIGREMLVFNDRLHHINANCYGILRFFGKIYTIFCNLAKSGCLQKACNATRRNLLRFSAEKILNRGGFLALQKKNTYLCITEIAEMPQ